MMHAVILLYVLAFAVGCGALTLVLLAWARYRTPVWGIFAAMIIAISLLVILDMMSLYQRAAQWEFPSFFIVRQLLGIPAETAVVVLLPFLACTIVSFRHTVPIMILHGAAGAVYAAGLFADASGVHPVLSVIMDGAFAVIVAFTAVITIAGFRAIRSGIMRALVVSIGIPTLTAAVIAFVLTILPVPLVHDVLLTVYYLSLAAVIIIHTLRYLSRGESLREAAGALHDRAQVTTLEKIFTRAKFTSRERELLSFVVCGYSNARIAGELSVSRQTVKNHIYNGFKKLGISNRNQFMDMLHSGSGD